MPHCEPEALSLLALGEPAEPHVSAHLADCAECRQELESLTSVVSLARPAPEDLPVVAVAPPAAVWDRIAAATGVTVAPRPAGVASPSGPARLVPVPDLVETAPPGPGTAEPVLGSSAPPLTPPAAADEAVVPLRRGRFGTRGLLLAAAAGLVLGSLGGAGVVAAVVDRDTAPPVAAPAPTPTVMVTVRLDPLGNRPRAHGSAEVVRDAGARELVVDVADLNKAEGFLEVWLIDRDVKRMVPVGVLHGPEGRFTLPDGLDLSQYPVVDISVEPLDGDPLHSGDSVLRGVLGS